MLLIDLLKSLVAYLSETHNEARITNDSFHLPRAIDEYTERKSS